MAPTADAGRVLLAVLVATAALSGGAFAATGATQECSFPYSKIDATGTEVTVETAPETVVTLSPSAAQTMWELDAQDKVAGVSKFATYLEGAEAKTNISGSGFTAVVVEKVVALDPDLVLAPNVISNETVGKLRDAGLTVYRFRAADTLDDVSAKTRLTGRLVGKCAAAEETVAGMEAELSTVAEAVSGEDRPRVLFVLDPAYGYTAGNGTFIDTAIETAGGENVAAAAGIEGYEVVSPEVVAERDPEWIVVTSGNPTVPKSAAYNGTTAVQEGNVVVVDSNFVSQPAPQIVRPIRAMAKAFHPEAYAAANETPTPSPTGTPSSTPSPTATPSPTPTETTGPGFGAAAAVLALIATLIVVRRD